MKSEKSVWLHLAKQCEKTYHPKELDILLSATFLEGDMNILFFLYMLDIVQTDAKKHRWPLTKEGMIDRAKYCMSHVGRLEALEPKPLTEREVWQKLLDECKNPASYEGLCVNLVRLNRQYFIPSEILDSVKNKIWSQRPVTWESHREGYYWPLSEEGNKSRIAFCEEQING